MKTVAESASRRQRVRQTAIAAFILVVISFALSVVLHRAAIGRVDAARQHMARGDWLAAIQCLDRARWEDPYLAETYLLRATALNEDTTSTLIPNRDFYRSREAALADIDWYLRYHPESGEAHYLRGVLLDILGRDEAARQELAQAIPLLKDPTDALVRRAALWLTAGDPKSAIAEISQAIERYPLEPALYEARGSYRPFVFDHRGAKQDQARAKILRESKGISREELNARVAAPIDYGTISEPQDGPAIAAERARFLGDWKVVAFQTFGGPKDTKNRDFSITFDTDGYLMVIDGKVAQDAPFWLDPGRHPRRIDWIAAIRGRESRLLGIYEFRGEDLAIVMGNAGEPRPNAVSPPEFDPMEFYILRRGSKSD
jgi:uncharacterized protein (TIGR03067 family)